MDNQELGGNFSRRHEDYFPPIGEPFAARDVDAIARQYRGRGGARTFAPRGTSQRFILLQVYGTTLSPADRSEKGAIQTQEWEFHRQ
jgi:hypothetical protein